jgi:hypothetical protein
MTALSLAGKGTVVAEKHSILSTLAKVCAFISVNDSFCYRQLQQLYVRNVVPALRCYRVPWECCMWHTPYYALVNPDF